MRTLRRGHVPDKGTNGDADWAGLDEVATSPPTAVPTAADEELVAALEGEIAGGEPAGAVIASSFCASQPCCAGAAGSEV